MSHVIGVTGGRMDGEEPLLRDCRPKTTFYTVECGHQGDEFYEHAIEVFHRHLNCLVSVDEEFSKVCKR